MVIGPLIMPNTEEFSVWAEDALAHGVTPEEMSDEYRKPFVDYVMKHHPEVPLRERWGGLYNIFDN